jgi:hypothetical protein
LRVYNTAKFVLDGIFESLDNRAGQGRGRDASDAPSATSGNEENAEEAGQAGRGDGARSRPQLIPGVSVSEYPIGLLRDAVTLTAEPSSNHRHSRHGLVYMQTYSPSKELFDAQGILPFSNPDIANLGYSEDDYASLSRIQKTHGDRSAAKRSDVQSRRRVASTTAHTKTQHFGWRTEMRVTVQLARLVRREDKRWTAFLRQYRQESRMETSRGGTTLVPSGQASIDINDITFPSSAFYVYRTGDFKSFLRGNIQKHLIALDSIRARYGPAQATPVATARLHALLVLSLRQFLHVDVGRRRYRV